MDRPRKPNPFYCKRHGDLGPDGFAEQGGKRAGKGYYVCKVCRLEWCREANKKRGRSHRPYKGEEGYEEWKKYALEKQKEDRKKLSNGSVRKAVCKKMNMKAKEVPIELVEVYRTMQKIERLKKK